MNSFMNTNFMIQLFVEENKILFMVLTKSRRNNFIINYFSKHKGIHIYFVNSRQPKTI